MKIAKTLSGILENDLVSTTLDRTLPIEETVKKVLEKWQPNLENRKPAPAYVEGVDGEPVYRGTDLDMFTFLYALASRNAVINLPDYKHMRGRTERSDEWIVSQDNRHGNLSGLISNSRTHAFSLRITDYNVVQLQDGKESVGSVRNFGVVDDTGELYRGLEQLEFRSTEQETDFFDFYSVWHENEIDFEHFVHPQLAKAFYGSRYITTKAIYNRILDQAEHYKAIAKKLREEGVRLGGRKRLIEYERIGETIPITATCLESKLMLPDFKGEYPIRGLTRDGRIKTYEQMPSRYTDKQNVLRYASRISRLLSYQVRPKLQAPIRAVELAFFQHGFYHDQREYGNEIQPGWDIPEWKRGFRESERARILWNALELNPMVNLLYRIRSVTTRKAA